MTLSIIIPAYNERNTIAEVLERVRNAPVFDYEKEIIVVDDGSCDGTEDILKNLDNDIVVLRNPNNRGKGFAIRKGLQYARGDVILIQDADLEYDPLDYVVLLEAYKNGKEVVYGSRNLILSNRGYFLYFAGNKILNTLFNFIYNANLSDIYTGYKLFRADIIKSVYLESNGFEIEPEISAKIVKKNISIAEIPIKYFPRKFNEGKKIRFKDGLKGIVAIIKYR